MIKLNDLLASLDYNTFVEVFDEKARQVVGGFVHTIATDNISNDMYECYTVLSIEEKNHTIVIDVVGGDY